MSTVDLHALTYTLVYIKQEQSAEERNRNTKLQLQILIHIFQSILINERLLAVKEKYYECAYHITYQSFTKANKTEVHEFPIRDIQLLIWQKEGCQGRDSRFKS